MRLALLCALVASAAFASVPSLRWTESPKGSVYETDSFRPGFEYKFTYDGQVPYPLLPSPTVTRSPSDRLGPARARLFARHHPHPVARLRRLPH